MTEPVESPLSAAIRQEIETRGPITFARFMSLALYHPNLGFYRRPTRPFGIAGDFFTAAQLQPVFGQCVLRFIQGLLTRIGGVHDGVLELGAGAMELSAALSNFGYRAYDWNTSPLPRRFTGVILAHEFFDALPIHLLTLQNRRWRELRVTTGPTGFQFVTAEPSSVLSRGARRHRQFITGELLELRPAAATWIKRISRRLDRGFLVVVDYGYTNPELARFPEGSLLSYRRHSAAATVLSDPGERDITAHVNFSELMHAAARENFLLETNDSLRLWLLSLWEAPAFQSVWSRWCRRERMQWKQLLVEMGETFRVLVFSRFDH